jgi:hypothetical protein
MDRGILKRFSFPGATVGGGLGAAPSGEPGPGEATGA